MGSLRGHLRWTIGTNNRPKAPKSHGRTPEIPSSLPPSHNSETVLSALHLHVVAYYRYHNDPSANFRGYTC
jgi:hypothetical protein